MLNQIGMAVVRQQIKSTCQDLRTKLHETTQKLYTDAKAFYRRVKTNPNFRKLMDKLDVLLCCFRRTPINERMLTESTEVETKMTSQIGERKGFRERLEERKDRKLPTMRQARNDEFLTRSGIKQNESLDALLSATGTTMAEARAKYQARMKPDLKTTAGKLQALENTVPENKKEKKLIAQKKMALTYLSRQQKFGEHQCDFELLIKVTFNSKQSKELVARLTRWGDVPKPMREELKSRFNDIEEGYRQK